MPDEKELDRIRATYATLAEKARSDLKGVREIRDHPNPSLADGILSDVARLKKGIAIPQERAKTSFFSPPFIKPVRPLSADDLFYRGMGTNVFSNVNADQREANLLAEDWADIDLRISRTENWMCSQCRIDHLSI
jgi:hypothetical protein